MIALFEEIRCIFGVVSFRMPRFTCICLMFGAFALIRDDLLFRATSSLKNIYSSLNDIILSDIIIKLMISPRDIL